MNIVSYICDMIRLSKHMILCNRHQFKHGGNGFKGWLVQHVVRCAIVPAPPVLKPIIFNISLN